MSDSNRVWWDERDVLSVRGKSCIPRGISEDLESLADIPLGVCEISVVSSVFPGRIAGLISKWLSEAGRARRMAVPEENGPVSQTFQRISEQSYDLPLGMGSRWLSSEGLPTSGLNR